MDYNKQTELTRVRAQISDLLKKMEITDSANQMEIYFTELITSLDEHPDGLDTEPLLVESVYKNELQTALSTNHPADLAVVVDSLNKILLLNI